MWEAASEYFNFIDDNPWQEEKVVTSGEYAGSKYYVDKIAPYTMGGLCIFLGVSPSYFGMFEKGKDVEAFKPVIALIRTIIYEQKFSGAAMGFLNAGLIGKDLGLVEKKMIGGDPDNPLPSPVTFYIPDNNRGSNLPPKGDIKQISNNTNEVLFQLD